MVFEPHVGGNIFDRGVDGSECCWARVLAYDPPHLVRFSSDVTTAWQIEPDPAKRSEIEITFTDTAPRRLSPSSTDERSPSAHGWLGE